jgi:hypothetical protein
MVASAIRIMALSAAGGVARAPRTTGRLASMLLSGVAGNIFFTISNVISGAASTEFVTVKSLGFWD